MITKERILKKFNGDEEKAAKFMDAFIISQEWANKEVEKMFDPEGEVMKTMMKEFDEYVDFLELPWWKRVMVRVGVMKM